MNDTDERFIRNVTVSDAEKITRKEFRIDQLDPDWTVTKMTRDFVYVARRGRAVNKTEGERK